MSRWPQVDWRPPVPTERRAVGQQLKFVKQKQKNRKKLGPQELIGLGQCQTSQLARIAQPPQTAKNATNSELKSNFKAARRKPSETRRRRRGAKMEEQPPPSGLEANARSGRNVVRLLNYLIVLVLMVNCSMEVAQATTSLGTNNYFYYSHNSDGIATFAQQTRTSLARRRTAKNFLAAAASDSSVSSTSGVQVGEGLSLRSHQQRQQHGQEPEEQQQSSVFQLPAKQMEKIKLENRVNANLGQNVVLNCPVQFSDGQEKPFVVNWLKYPNKLPIYIWYAGYPPHVAQGYENRVARLGQASLNLSSIRSQDQGLYECKIYYLDRKPDDKANGTWIYLDVQAPPRFTRTPTPVNYVQAGDSVHLTCQAQSSPAPILRWYKNKVPIDSDAGAYRLSAPLAPDDNNNSTSADSNEDEAGEMTSEQQQRRRPTATHRNSSASPAAASHPDGQALNQLDLFIDNVQAGATTGDYVCLASNSEGSVEARSSVLLAIPAVITTLPRNQTRLEGERVELACQAKALPANITYKWLFNDKPIQQLKWFESRYTQRRDGTLVIHSVHRDDQGDYKCQASNGLRAAAAAANNNNNSNSRAQVAEAAAYLQVEFPARITYSPPVQYLPFGLSGLIRCFYQASPQVEFFTWTLNNQQFDPNIDPNVERLQNGSLLIRQVSKQYEGKYRCTPFNKHGSAGSSNAMEVRVEEPPQFELRPADFYKANLNGQVKIPCEARGSPKPIVSWRRVATTTTSGANQLQEQAGTAAKQQQQLNRLAIRPKRHQMGSLDPAAGSMQQQQTIQRQLVSSSSNAHLSEDEAADEPDETHHFYTPTSTTNSPATSHMNDEQQHQLHLRQHHQSIIGQPPPPEQQHEQEQSSPSGTTAATPSSNDYDADGEEQQQPQQPVTVYAKLPSDRSEFKNSYLYLHNLKKEDHGSYECVIENEVATLVAATMLYIEETTPHAPTNVRVDAKAWSAHVSWTPGYDGGFEQSFVVWYRQVDHRPRGSQSFARSQQMNTNELIDINWHSANVQPSDATSFTIENLSQDTIYEFYVRAKNIIGEGPRSQIVQAQTKRAISGSVTPIVDAMASSTTSANQPPTDEFGSVSPLPGGGGDEEENEPKHHQQQLITIRQPVAIIRPEIIQHPRHQQQQQQQHQANGYDTTSASQLTNQQDDFTSSNNSSHSAQQNHQQPTSSLVEPSQTDENNKVIHYKVIHQTNNNSNSSTGNGKRAPQTAATNEPQPSGRNSKQQKQPNSTAEQTNSNQPPQAPIDRSTAPQNVSITKVAQGWVLEWAAPERLPMASDDPSYDPAPNSLDGNGRAEAMRSPKQQQQQQEAITEQSIDGLNKRQQQPPPQQPPPLSPANQEPAAYTVELREKSQPNWHTLTSTGRERSLLIKDLKPGGEYLFRVLAHSAFGLKGSPSAEFRYQIPDNRRKPGSTQALSAGVVSGILFFIACIVIAVCGVNMCNKRRKKRAEKAAYVMMACPVLESHHDIAALNSNSLMKNPQCNGNNPAQDRVPSLANGQRRTNNYLSDNLDYSNQKHRRQPPPPPSDDDADEKLSQFKRMFASTKGANKLYQLVHSKMVAKHDSTVANKPQQQQPHLSSAGQNMEREISFGPSTPLPVDVEPIDQVAQARRSGRVGRSGDQADFAAPGDENEKPAELAANHRPLNEPIDDYWIRQPSDRKWGTLTLAAGKLAERRAELRRKRQQHDEQLSFKTGTSTASRTLPRSFRNQLDYNQQQHSEQLRDSETWAQLRQKFFQQKASRANQLIAPPPVVPPRLPTNQHHHQRSVSQIEPPSFWPQTANSSHLIVAQNQQLATACWPITTTTNSGTGWPAPLGSQSFVLPAPPLADNSNQMSMMTNPCCHAGGQFQTLCYPQQSPTNNTCQQQPAGEQSSFLGKRNSLARSTLPMVAQVSCGQTILAPPYNQAHDLSMYSVSYNQNGSSNNNDDLVIANACFGSYKRKQRLPHIEAQFTITKPASRSARDAGSSHLFVRDLNDDQQQQQPVGSLRPPPGFPLSGQRSEQKQLKLLMPTRSNNNSGETVSAQVETIDAKEKIETYLRHYDRQQQRPSGGGATAADTKSIDDLSSAAPVELDKVDSITFQPYYNLPSLCYTINLPVKKQPDGKLVLEETSQMKPQRRAKTTSTTRTRTRLRRKAARRAEESATGSGGGDSANKSVGRQPLGSSSSCPAQTIEQQTGRDADHDQLANSSAALNSSSSVFSRQMKQVCSLESAIENPLIANRPNDSQQLVDCGSLFAQDSLELLQVGGEDYDDLFVVIDNLPPPPPLPAKSEPNRHSSVQVDGDPLERQQQSQRNNKSRPSEPPPPVPPHQAASRRASSSSVSAASSSASDGDESNSSSTRTNGAHLSSPAANHNQAKSNSGADHSVDENYEFDQNSSCSSSTATATTTNVQSSEHQPSNKSTGSSRADGDGAPAAIYAQVDKQTKRARGEKVSVVERAHYFVGSRFKEQKLTTPATKRATTTTTFKQDQTSERETLPATRRETNYYDTVYDAAYQQLDD